MSATITTEEVQVLSTFRRTHSFEQTARELKMQEAEVRKVYDRGVKKEQALLLAATGKVMEERKEGEAAAPTTSYRFVQRLQLRLNKPQIGTMKVGSKILDLLSSGIYSSPENALKELISNSFDADATRVNVRTSPDFERITIEDNGEGMDFQDFDDRFTVISRSVKRDQGDLTPVLKRPIIGKIGIGFVAVAQICDEMKVTSAKRGSDTWFEASIDFSKFHGKDAERKEFYEVSQFTLVNHKKFDRDQHFTRIELNKLKKGFKSVLTDRERANPPPYTFSRLKSFKQLMNEIDTLGIKNTHKEIVGFWRFVLNLAMIIPIEYLDAGPIALKNSNQAFFDNLKNKLSNLNFKVVVNGLELRKPIKLPLERDDIEAEGSDFNTFVFDESLPREGGPAVHVFGYLYNQRKNISLEDMLRGLVIRVRNTAIGRQDHDFMGYPYPEKIPLTWTFGEIYADGLEDAMNIDRHSFKFDDPAYQAVARFVHELIHSDVIPNAGRRYKERKKSETEIETSERNRRRAAVVKAVTKHQFPVIYSARVGKAPVQIIKGKVIINRGNEVFVAVKRKDRPLLEDVLLATRLVFFDEKARSRDEFWEAFVKIFGQLKKEKR